MQDDCKYHCMHERMQQLHAAAPAFARTVKFHGKWPFTRVLGFQVWARLHSRQRPLALERCPRPHAHTKSPAQQSHAPRTPRNDARPPKHHATNTRPPNTM